VSGRVVVVGGGIAGLTAAFRRATSGETTLLEGSTRLGGSIRTIREDGFVVEAGPNTLRTTAAAESLIRDLGLERDVVLADGRAPRWIVRDGRPRAIVPGPKGIFNEALSTSGKLRLLGDWRVPRRPDTLEDESVHAFFVRRFGEDAATYGAGPMVSGVYAGDPKSLSVRSAFPHLWEAEGRSGSVIRDFLKGGFSFNRNPDGSKAPRFRPRTLNFTRGLFQMVEALSMKLSEAGVAVETGAAATAIEGPRRGAPGRRWTVRTADGRAFDADVVVSTLDAQTTAALLDGRLPRSRGLVAAIPAAPVSTVIFAFSPGSPDAAPRGFGALVPRTEQIRSLGVLYPASLFAGRAPSGVALTTSFLGGALDPGAAALPDPDLLALALRDVRELHPLLTADPDRHWITRWPKAIPQLPLGHHRAMEALEADLGEVARAAGAEETLVLTGGWRDGIALGARIERGEAIGKAL
jgi:oxygen-dependent protoporphyrinogen oxidase